MNNEERDLREMNVNKLMLKLAMPMVVAMIVNGLYYLVDAAFVGLAVNKEALSGLAVVFPIQMLAVAIATMIGIGASILISRFLGEHKKDEAKKVLANGITFSCMIGLVIPIILILFEENILKSLGVMEESYIHAKSYYNVIVPGFILIFISFLEVNTIRAEGNAKFAAFGMFLGSILNIIFDAIFIFGLGLGTSGAAWGTIVARLITTILLSNYYFTGKSAFSLEKKDFKVCLKYLKQIHMLGLGSFLNHIGFSILAIFMNILLKKYGTLDDMAVYGVMSRIMVFVVLPLMGVAQGFLPIVSYSYGAKQFERIKKSIKVAYMYSSILGSIIWLIVIIMPNTVLGLFTNDVYIIQKGVPIMKMMLLATPIIGCQQIAYFYFMSIGKIVNSLFVALFRQVVFIIPLILLLPIFVGVKGIYIAYPIADILSVVVSTYMIYKVNRQYSESMILKKAY